MGKLIHEPGDVFFYSAWLDGGRGRMARVFFSQGGVQTAKGLGGRADRRASAAARNRRGSPWGLTYPKEP